jgi:hypothetical protein
MATIDIWGWVTAAQTTVVQHGYRAETVAKVRSMGLASRGYTPSHMYRPTFKKLKGVRTEDDFWTQILILVGGVKSVLYIKRKGKTNSNATARK